MKKLILLLTILTPLFVFGQKGHKLFEEAQITIEKTTLNTKGSDFGPSFVNDELWFSSFTPDEIELISRGKTKNIFYNLYSSELDSKLNVRGRKNIELEDISAGYHAGPTSYCKATNELFVTLSNYKNLEIRKEVFKKADVRLKIVILEEKNGVWVLKEELPFNSPLYSVGHPAVSTTGDTLYFSSDIPDKGFGDTDIYRAIRKKGQWGEMQNLGKNINTKEADMFPFIYKSNMLIYASNGKEDGKGGLDLYYSYLNSDKFTEPVNLDKVNSEEDDFSLVIHKNEEVGYYTSSKIGGRGSDDIYKIVIEKILDVKGKVVEDATDNTIQGALVELKNCQGTTIDKSYSNEKGEVTFRVKDGCYRAKASKLPYYEDEQAIKNNMVELRLKGDYNLELTVIDKKTQESISNATVAFSDGKKLNTDSKGILKRELDDRTKYIATSELNGYMNESVSINTESKSYGIINQSLYVEKVEEGQTFTLDNIHYDYDKWDILPASAIELDKLVKVMNDNPMWKVELGSHTDSRGSDMYNKRLSQKRSDSAVGYIISKGISEDRIVAKGYGETQLLNRCKNGVKCSDEEHRQNRRTEFKILKLN